MWKFVDEKCSRCAIDLTTVEPERIRWRWLHPYSRCPKCGDVCPAVEVPDKPESEAGLELPPREAPAEEPEPEPEAPPGEAPAEEPGPAPEPETPGEERGGV
ncbi:unnamed protein product [marine sediment metagenome]|uniref:Uncharacterized protein n=1 Tax=marine sediment metagenome TaxID=412755 RepID=X1QWJ9_9ZZZZ